MTGAPRPRKKIGVLPALLIAAALAAAAWFFVAPGLERAGAPRLPEKFFSSFGDGRMYDYSVSTTVDYSAGADQSVFIVQKLSGVLNVKLLERNENSAVLAMQFSPLSMKYESNGDVQQVDPVAESSMRQIFLVTANALGYVQRFEFPPDIPEALAAVLEGAVRAVQIALPEEAAPRGETPSWRTTETDSNGRNLAAYAMTQDGGIRKRRLSYGSEADAPNASNAPKNPIRTSVRSSDILGVVDDGWIVRVKGYEENEFFAGGGRLATGKNIFSMALLPFEPEKSGASIWNDRRTAEQVRSWFVAMRGRMEAERKFAGEPARESRTPQNMRAQLAARLVPDLVRNRGLFNELVAFLTENPEAAAMMPEMILGIRDDALNDRLILALQLCGTPAAQEALCSIMGDARHERLNRLRATASFSFVELPTAESIAALRRAADSAEAEYAGTALLAIGGSAAKLRDADPPRYAEVAKDLRTRLGSARESGTYGAERTALHAIGNAGDPAFLPEVEAYLKGEDASNRVVAAESMRHMRGAEVDRLLIERIESDTVADVRRAAAKSLAEQPSDPETVRRISGAIESEHDRAVETEMAVYLGRSAQKNPEARATLERLWDTTDNRDVLRVIRDVRRGRTP